MGELEICILEEKRIVVKFLVVVEEVRVFLNGWWWVFISMKYMVVCILYIKRSDGIVSFLNYSIYKMA